MALQRFHLNYVSFLNRRVESHIFNFELIGRVPACAQSFAGAGYTLLLLVPPHFASSTAGYPCLRVAATAKAGASIPHAELVSLNVDVHEPEVRSYNMSQIKGKNTKPEMFSHINLFPILLVITSH